MMLIYKSYKTALRPTKEQEVLFNKAAGTARFVYNWGLAQRIEEYKQSKKTSTAISQHKELNALKETKFPWMYEVSKCVAQQALRDLDTAYKNFFRSIKKKNGKPGFPKFKSKHTSRESFFVEGSIHVGDNWVQLPRIGKVRLHESNYIPNENVVKVLSAVVSKRAGRWFVSVQVQGELADMTPQGGIIGIDLGIKDMATLSDGRVFANHKALKKNERKLARLQRSFARKKKGSNNRAKAKLALAKAHYKVSCIRVDSIHKFVGAVLAKAKPAPERPTKIVIEDLNVRGMLKNRRLSKALSNVAFGEIRRQLEYKCKWYGVELVVADRFYPSSKTCSACGAIYHELQLSEREWTCRECGIVHDRDLNAAINLSKYTANSVEINACGDQVRPATKYKLRSGQGRRSKNQDHEDV
jgi:putative transposase